MIPIWKLSGRLGNQMFRHAYLYAKMRDGAIPDIYLQSEDWFYPYGEEIKQLFGTGIEPIGQVSVHIRRGDYVDNPFYVDLTKTGYYEEAMGLFPEESFLIFSDDPAWCKERFGGKRKVEICYNTDEVESLNMMAGCKHNIIANSSFSWWAAYLNPNPHKKVVCPRAWYTDGVERTICPSSWIKK